MNKYLKPLVALNLALILGLAGWLVAHKERIMANGQLVLLRLNPRDPRSLMQGDYMELRYTTAVDLGYDSIPARGYAILTLDSQGVGWMQRAQETLAPLEQGEIPIKYYYNERFVSIGAESFLFEEGQDTVYANARYGALRISPDGESVLIGLYSEQFEPLGGAQ